MQLSLTELNQRVGQLEHLARSLYRALETYITVTDMQAEEGEASPPEGVL